MNKILDLGRLTQETIPEDPDQRRALLAALEGALTELDCIRLKLERNVADATEQRRALLLDDTAAGIKNRAGLDQIIESARLDLERSELIEQALVERCDLLNRLTEAHDRNSLCADYGRAVVNWAAAHAASVDARNALIALRERAVMEGHEARLGVFDLPSQQFPLDFEAVASFKTGALTNLHHAREAPPKGPKLYVVRFIESFAPYHIGMRAGFAAEPAWKFVDKGIAVWDDPRKRPSRAAVMGG